MLSLETLLGRLPEFDEWEGQLAGLRQRINFTEVGFVAAWELQSYIATLVLVALVGLLSPWAALVVMLVWSVVAALVYYAARARGLPNPLEHAEEVRARPLQAHGVCAAVAVSLLKAWLAGAQAFLYSRTVCRALSRPAASRPRRLYRAGVVGLGLTLFGVTAADHILRRAGYSGGSLLRLSLVGPLLNVPYRVLLSALVVEALLGVYDRLLGGGVSLLSPV
jgi:hypothetical protein